MKMTKYYIVYESYTDYNQFEGSWDYEVKKFDDFNKAKEYYERLMHGDCRYNHRNVLFLTEALKLKHELEYSI